MFDRFEWMDKQEVDNGTASYEQDRFEDVDVD